MNSLLKSSRVAKKQQKKGKSRSKKKGMKIATVKKSRSIKTKITEVYSQIWKKKKNNRKPVKLKEGKEVAKLQIKLQALVRELTKSQECAMKHKEEARNMKDKVAEWLKKNKVEEDTRNKEIITIFTRAERMILKLQLAIKVNEVMMSNCFNDVKWMEQCQLRSKEKYRKRIRKEDKLWRRKNKDKELNQKFNRQLKKLEEAYNNCQLSLDRVQSWSEIAQESLEKAAEKLSISEKKARKLEASLQGELREKSLLESDVKKTYARLYKALKKLRNESNLVVMLKKDKDLAESCITEQLALMRERVLLTKAEEKQRDSERLKTDAVIRHLTSRLEAASRAINDENEVLRRENETAKLATKEADVRKQELQCEKQVVEKMLSFLQIEHYKVTLEKCGLQDKVGKISVKLGEMGRKRKMAQLKTEEAAGMKMQRSKKLKVESTKGVFCGN